MQTLTESHLCPLQLNCLSEKPGMKAETIDKKIRSELTLTQNKNLTFLVLSSINFESMHSNFALPG